MPVSDNSVSLTPTRFTPCRWRNQPAIRIEGDGLAAVVLPGRGGKIAALCDSLGREWLHQPHGTQDVSPPPPAAGFTDSDLFGWDECAPTIRPGTLPDGTSCRGHGDLWGRPWRSSGGVAWCRGTASGFLFARSIRAIPRGLRLRYRVCSAVAAPFSWSAHPQFAAPAGSRVELGPGDHQVVPFLAGRQIGPAVPWAAAPAAVDALPYGTRLKLRVHPAIRLTSASLRRADGGRLTLSWPAGPVAHLALFFDNHAVADGPVISIQPTLTDDDSLAVLMANHTERIVDRGHPLSWFVDLTVDSRC